MKFETSEMFAQGERFFSIIWPLLFIFNKISPRNVSNCEFLGKNIIKDMSHNGYKAICPPKIDKLRA